MQKSTLLLIMVRRLSLALSLAWVLALGANAQSAARVYDPAMADPQYNARKLRMVKPAAVVTRPAQPTVRTGSSPTLLPACFETLDSVSAPAAGGYINVPRNDDGSIGPIALGFTFTLFGSSYTSVYINTNGNLSFTAPVSQFSATGFPIATPMVAAFWADVDTRPASSGSIWYKVYPNRMVVTWNRVGYFSQATDKKNTFQIVIRANSAAVLTDDVTFAYGDMQWTTGSASGGTNGFGGSLATVGVNRGTNNDFIQTGRFNLNNATHPDNVSPSGVNWLDDQCISYRVFANGNLPPSATNLPANSTITVNQGQTVSIAPQFSGPEAGQAITLAVNTNGLCNTTFTVSPGINPTLNLSVTGGLCNVGTNVINVTATDNGTPVASRQFPITVIVNPPPGANGQWTGNVSTVYTDPANWSNSVLPTATMDVTIPALAIRMPVLSGVASGLNITVASGATLAIASGGALTANGAFISNGTVSGAGSLIMGGSAVQNLGGSSPINLGNVTVGSVGAQLTGPLSVRQLLTLTGNLATASQLLTLLSDATGTAMVVNNGGAVSGNATVQRYIDPSLNAGAGYRHYSAPVSNTTMGDLATTGFSPVFNTVYNTAPVPANVSPFPNVFGFDETRITNNGANSFDRGWFSPSDATNAMTPGMGYTVNVGAASTVDFVGALGNGTVSRAGLTCGTRNESGWQLLGNPYPAPIDWTLMTGGLSGVDNAVYVYKSSGTYAGSYASFVNGVGPARFIPVAQGFFVRTTTAGTPGTVSFSNSARLTTYLNPAFNRSLTQETRPLVQLDLVSSTQRDAATLYFEQGATAGFDSRYDAYKIDGGNLLRVAALAGTEALSISGLPALAGADVVLPLQVRVPVLGTYTLEAAQLLNLPAGYTPYLQDDLTGSSTNLRLQPTYSFSMDAAFIGSRFTLLLAYNRVLATTNSHLSGQALLYPNPAHDAANLLLPDGLAKFPVSATLLNALGQAVRTYELPARSGTAPHALSLAGVARGVYTLRLTTASGVATKRLVVE